MTRRLSQLALLLYPLAFRRRYGEEMRALLDQEPARAPIAVDLLRGALAAHLHPRPALANLVGPADRVRASASGVLACWVAFSAAGFGFYKTTEEAAFRAAGHAHPLLGAAHLVISAIAILASAAIALAALPLIAAALVRARRSPRLRPVLALPALAVAIFAGLTAALALLARSRPPTSVGSGAFIVWAIAGLACGAVCAAAFRSVLFAVPLARGRLIAALSAGTLVTAAMAAIALATAVYAIALALEAPRLGTAPNGPGGVLSVSASLIVQLVVMGAAGMLAAVATRRGWRVGAHLDSRLPR